MIEVLNNASHVNKGKLYCKQKKEEQNKENCNIHHVEIYDSKEMSTALNALIYSVGQEECVENFDQKNSIYSDYYNRRF